MLTSILDSYHHSIVKELNENKKTRPVGRDICPNTNGQLQSLIVRQL